MDVALDSPRAIGLRHDKASESRLLPNSHARAFPAARFRVPFPYQRDDARESRTPELPP